MSTRTEPSNPWSNVVGFFDAIRQGTGSILLDGGLNLISRLGKLHPHARRIAKGIRVERNVAYGDAGKPHLLDIYRPHTDEANLPVVVYVHGGGFRILSKDTHWMMGHAFASRGYVVFNVNYHLAPKHPYPKALQDVAEAILWVRKNAESYGGDPSNISFAGESAGANLVTAYTVASCYKGAEDWEHAIFDANIIPRTVMPACGLLQVSDPERIRRRKPQISNLVADRINKVSTAYLGQELDAIAEGDFGLADPLVVLESDRTPERPLPSFLITCGTRDPLLHDTRRLHAALLDADTDTEMKIYVGGGHAFHAFVWTDLAKECWRDHFDFMSNRVV